MSRRDDLNSFYEILDELRGRVGGYRRLQECTGKSGWPERGCTSFSRIANFEKIRKLCEWCEWGPTR
jgi:hypothetical protein